MEAKFKYKIRGKKEDKKIKEFFDCLKLDDVSDVQFSNSFFISYNEEEIDDE